MLSPIELQWAPLKVVVTGAAFHSCTWTLCTCAASNSCKREILTFPSARNQINHIILTVDSERSIDGVNTGDNIRQQNLKTALINIFILTMTQITMYIRYLSPSFSFSCPAGSFLVSFSTFLWFCMF